MGDNNKIFNMIEIGDPDEIIAKNILRQII